MVMTACAECRKPFMQRRDATRPAKCCSTRCRNAARGRALARRMEDPGFAEMVHRAARGTQRIGTAEATRRPTASDLAWAAGFLEGEGSFIWHSNSQRVGAGQVNREPLERLLAMFGGRIYFSTQAAARARGVASKDFWQWAAFGARARGVMFTLFTHLSRRRKDQVRQALRAA